MPQALRLTVIALARLIYFWVFIAVFGVVLALVFQKPWLAGHVVSAFGQWQWWSAAAVAVTVGRFPLLDDFLNERL